MFGALKKRFSEYQLVIVGGDFNSEGGAWRSIYSLYQHLDSQRAPVLLVDLRRRDGWRRWICAIFFSPKIVVNGMSAVSKWRVLLGLFIRRDVAIYLHDTQYMLDAFQNGHPFAYRVLSQLLRKRTVMCVSAGMAQLYQDRFGTRNTKVVYEVIDLEPEPVLDPGRKHIVMVGSLDRRKGYPLFADVAEKAAKQGLQWEFHWVGGLGEGDLAPVSQAITWWGRKASPNPILRQADVFFLSSIDDPQPLACLEAASLSCRCVVFRQTGSSEVVGQLPGCRVFDEYEVDAVIRSLRSALDEEVDAGRMRERLAELVSVEAFQRRLQGVFSDRDS